jgi:DNA-binding NarL/FixJ family response regulator
MPTETHADPIERAAGETPAAGSVGRGPARLPGGSNDAGRLPTRMAVAAPGPCLRRQLADIGAAAGFTVCFPTSAVEWADFRDGVVLITVAGPGELVVLEHLRASRRRSAVITLIGPGPCSARLGYAALRAGAHVVVDRLLDARGLLAAVELARRDHALLPAGLLQELVDRPVADPTAGRIDPGIDLDAADRRLLQDLADGATIQRMARQRHQATRTVERHLRRVYARIGAGDRVQAVAKAARCGLVTLPV